MASLSGKVAIVTGGGGGIGRGVGLALAKEGASVALVDIDESAARSVAEAIQAVGGRALVIPTDIRRPDEVAQSVDATVAAFGTVDILVNNAQAAPGILSLEEHSDEDFLLTLETGPLATWYFTKACFPHLSGGGRIINFRSGAEVQGRAGHAAYNAAKGAIHALTKTTAREWGKYGITANCINPGVMHPKVKAILEGGEGGLAAAFADRSIQRDGDAESDVGRVVVFLAGPDASFITGTTVGVDGGTIFP